MSANSSQQSALSPASYGLPLDLWREVLSYLQVYDLCQSAQVCRSWRYLVASLDVSSWRFFFLQSTEWKHPNWPRQGDDVRRKKSWQSLYREHAVVSKLWAYPSKYRYQSKCFAPLLRKSDRKTIEVGKLCSHKTLRSALDVATQYDRILIHPGIYDEQFEISAKIPFELVGHGAPGSVILVLSVEQNAITGRLCNLYIKAPWFTTHVIKVSSGHLQIDNCVLEESQVMVQNPATCHFRYCSFRRVHMILNHLNSSLIENSQFKHCTVSVQGYPKETRGWAYEHLLSLTSTWDKPLVSDSASSIYNAHTLLSNTSGAGSSLHTTQSTQASSAFEVNKEEVDSIGVASIDESTDNSQGRSNSERRGSDSSHYTFNSFSSLSSQHSDHSNEDNEQHDSDHDNTSGKAQHLNVDSKEHSNHDHSNHHKHHHSHHSRHKHHHIEHNTNRSQPNSADSRKHKHGHSSDTQNKSLPRFGANRVGNQPIDTPGPSSFNELDDLKELSNMFGRDRTSLRAISISSRSKLTLNNLPAPEILEMSSEDERDSRDSHSTASSTNISLLETTGRAGHISPPWSSDSESVLEAKIQTSFRETLDKDPDLRSIIREIHGPVFRKCVFHNGQGGLKVSLQAHCRVESSLFRELQYAIRCLQNAKVAVLENEICHCSASGIYMRLAAHGLIAGNDIYCTSEAAIDVRRQADPVIQCNRIHHSKRSGIVVLGSGCGLIRGNDIYQNREPAIYVLYRGNPYIVGNRICHGLASGVTVQEHGRGYVIDNYIAHNRWAGIDIRSGGDPLVSKNMICNGQSNGIAVSNRGRGVLDDNNIKGNDGCGVYVMNASPLIRTNQIYNNNDTGVAFIHEEDEGGETTTDDDQSLSSELSDELDVLSMAGEVGQGDLWISNESKYRSPEKAQLAFNTIFHNNGYGILCSSGEALKLHGNACHNNKHIGIYVKQQAPVTISNNSVTSNAGTGVHVSVVSKVDIDGNGIYENSEHGIMIQGEAAIRSNDVFCNHLSALALVKEANVTAKENRLQAVHETTVHAGKQCQASFHDNQFYVSSGHQAVITNGNQHLVAEQQGNTIISVENEQGDHVTDWHLEHPPPRPHITPPSPIIPPPPRKRITTVTRVVMPRNNDYMQQSSFCAIL